MPPLERPRSERNPRLSRAAQGALGPAGRSDQRQQATGVAPRNSKPIATGRAEAFASIGGDQTRGAAPCSQAKLARVERTALLGHSNNNYGLGERHLQTVARGEHGIRAATAAPAGQLR